MSNPGQSDRATSGWSLRGQLLLALALILPVVAISVGFSTLWSVRRQRVDDQMLQLHQLSLAMAAVVKPMMATAQRRKSSQLSRFGSGISCHADATFGRGSSPERVGADRSVLSTTTTRLAEFSASTRGP